MTGAPSDIGRVIAPIVTLAVASFALGLGDPVGGQEAERLGTVDFPTSCAPEVRAGFDRSLALLHSFAWERAIRGFESVAEQDPDCAMAFWGIAAASGRVAWGPAYMQVDAGTRAIRRAMELGGGSERERAYIAAMAHLFQGADSLGHAIRLQRHVDAMERLHDRYPEDREAALFYAVALLGTVDATALNRDVQRRAGELAEAVFDERPDHPGAAHYVIHSYDYPELAEGALPAARRYAEIAPATPHARHMPSHIYSRLGLWEESIESNLSVLEVADAAPIHAAHSLDYLVYSHLQRGEPEAAAAALEELMDLAVEHADQYDAAGHAVDASVRYVLERGDWNQAATLELDPSLLYDPRFEATLAFARAVGAARSGDPVTARREAGRLRALRVALEGRGDVYPAANVTIWATVASAWIRQAEGSSAEAVDLMRQAVRLDQAKSYVGSFEFGPDELVQAREELGALLLELRLPAEALLEFQRSLESSPDRFNALGGAARAARLAGDRELARDYYGRLLDVASDGAQGAVIEEAKRFLQR